MAQGSAGCPVIGGRDFMPPLPDPFSEGVRQTLAIIEDHWPEVVLRADEGWDLECACGWDGEYIDWHQHLDNAVDAAIGVEARSGYDFINSLGTTVWEPPTP